MRLTKETFRKLFPKAYHDEFCKPNLGVHLDTDSSKATEPIHLQPLVEGKRRGKRPKISVALRITIVVYRERHLDSDSVSASCKWIRDAIAESLGVDDGDPKIDWEYEQVRTRGQQGVMVKVEL